MAQARAGRSRRQEELDAISVYLTIHYNKNIILIGFLFRWAPQKDVADLPIH